MVLQRPAGELAAAVGADEHHLVLGDALPPGDDDLQHSFRHVLGLDGLHGDVAGTLVDDGQDVLGVAGRDLTHLAHEVDVKASAGLSDLGRARGARVAAVATCEAVTADRGVLVACAQLRLRHVDACGQRLELEDGQVRHVAEAPVPGGGIRLGQKCLHVRGDGPWSAGDVGARSAGCRAERGMLVFRQPDRSRVLVDEVEVAKLVGADDVQLVAVHVEDVIDAREPATMVGDRGQADERVGHVLHVDDVAELGLNPALACAMLDLDGASAMRVERGVGNPLDAG